MHSYKNILHGERYFFFCTLVRLRFLGKIIGQMFKNRCYTIQGTEIAQLMKQQIVS
jgi:hypothetical protein